jgi:hypothetical protein
MSSSHGLPEAAQNSEIGICGVLFSCALSLDSLSIVTIHLPRLISISNPCRNSIRRGNNSNLQHKNTWWKNILLSECGYLRLLHFSTLYNNLRFEDNCYFRSGQYDHSDYRHLNCIILGSVL